MPGTSGSPVPGIALVSLRRRLARSWLRRAGRVAVPVVVGLAAALIADLAVHDVTFLLYAERFVEDLRIAAWLPTEPQDSNVVVVAINEQTLEMFPYRS